MTEEEKRLAAAREETAPWRLWGPYLSERQWGTVREDYSADGDAWNYLTHDQSRSRAYRWGEDGIAGISDIKQLLCFSLALWNGKDPILKERLFGLNGHEGNHGEDVKEYYFYLDNLPSHAYMKYLYKYPQEAFPYENLVEENGRRTREDFEYELLDTKIFDEDRYFDVFVEYAKETPEDLLIQITIHNRGKEKAPLHILPTLWFRNTWSWQKGETKPSLTLSSEGISASHPQLGKYQLFANEANEWLFTENETNMEKLYSTPNPSPFVKDGFHEFLIHGKREAVNGKSGTKAAPHYFAEIEASGSTTFKLRLTKNGALSSPFDKKFDACFATRKKEADLFYQKISPYPLSDDMRNIQRQAFAGLLWNKQCYHYNVNRWLQGDPNEPKPPPGHQQVRNEEWWNLDAYDIFSMPDKWEYPWFAAWDLAFHTIALALIDPDFAKHQLLLLTKEWYMHPNGQIPAYEWSFSDVNPPVQAWAAMRVYQIEQAKQGRTDRTFLEIMFQKMSLNFTWWVNRKDINGRNMFSGGFLGLDNIGAFNRSVGPPMGGVLEQTDGTGWMGMYCLNLLQIALELAKQDSAYEDMATKYFEHFIFIADAINNVGNAINGLWDEKNGFYYGLLMMPDGRSIRITQDTIIGVVPLFAVATNDSAAYTPFPQYRERFEWFIKHRPELLLHIGDLSNYDVDGHLLISMASPYKLKKILQKILDENQFLSPFGIRSVSKKLAENPYVLHLGGKEYRVDYEPAESRIPLFGGNSNWRGPIWFPLNFLFIESLQKYHYYLGDEYKIEYPVGSGKESTLWEVTEDLSLRLIKIFLKDKNGRRPVYGGIEKFQTDPHWKEYILFHEYFHGDNGAGLGASQQTGWTGLVAKLINQYGAYALDKKTPQKIEQK